MFGQASPAELSWPQAATSAELRDKVANAKVLAVGAGGIGCELLKTLAMTGFNHIDVVDLDTIETSNLNRQFLFRKRHVGSSKAAVAAEAVKSMRKGMNITAHQGNVKDPQYGLDFFQRFDLVLNGLDNLEARRHVNRLCLAAGVPLVESGTAGYKGQCTVHVRGETECYECAPKPAPKSYPVCTIRNTPDKPIHCVVWAKDLLFPRLFGGPEAVTDLDDSGGKEGEGNGAGDAAPGEREDPSFYAKREGESSSDFAARIFRRVYGTDIESLLKVDSLWHARRPPTPLHLDEILEGSNGAVSALSNGAAPPLQQNGNITAAASEAPSACKSLGLANPHAVWDLRQCASVFLEAVRLFYDRRPSEVGSAQFDKDDALAVEFVTAASNLRALCYGVTPQSLFDAKGMAGSIIHAIATTNAIVSGLIVVEALKLLAGCRDACKYTYLQPFPSSGRLLTAERAPPPRPGCMVCGKAQVHLAINTRTATLRLLVDKVVKGRLSLVEPSLSCGAFQYDEGEGLEEDEVAFNAALLARPLCELPGGGLGNGSILELSDQQQHLTAQLVVLHREDLGSEEENPDGFILTGSLPEAQHQEQQPGPSTGAGGGPAAAAAGGAAGEAGSAGEAQHAQQHRPKRPQVREEEDGVLVLEDSDEEGQQQGSGPSSTAAGKAKRKAADMEEEGQGPKRAKLVGAAKEEEEEEIILLDDD
ncbi:hypothetical protein N2152v2_002180 [Parachlorella kessleri]